MLQLLLLRHAKSSWDEPGLDDMQRPLNGRGKRDAAAMGKHIAELGLAPKLTLCSPAERTRETWLLVRDSLIAPPAVKFEPRLYDFGDGEELIDMVRENESNATPLLIIGHNPSLEGMALRLCDRDSGKLRERMEKKYPTATLAVFELPIANWHQLAPGMGRLTQFMRPKDLQEL